MAYKKDISGFKFGMLTAIKNTGKKNQRRNYLWECLCECGNTIELSTGTILRPRDATRRYYTSCGCKKKRPTGFGNRSNVIRSYIKGAKVRGLDWKLTDNEAIALFSQDCFYCGSKPSNVMNKVGHNGEFIYNGIDRKDNTQGYVSNNVVACCRICNRAKNAMGFTGFMDWITQVARYRNVKFGVS